MLVVYNDEKRYEIYLDEFWDMWKFCVVKCVGVVEGGWGCIDEGMVVV